MTDRKRFAIAAVLIGLIGLIMAGLTARADAGPPATPDQVVQKYQAPDQVVQQKMTYGPDQVVQQKTYTYSLPIEIGPIEFFQRQPCQPVRNIIRRVIREKIKDRLVPTPPSFPIGFSGAALSDRSITCIGARCW